MGIWRRSRAPLQWYLLHENLEYFVSTVATSGKALCLFSMLEGGIPGMRRLFSNSWFDSSVRAYRRV